MYHTIVRALGTCTSPAAHVIFINLQHVFRFISRVVIRSQWTYFLLYTKNRHTQRYEKSPSALLHSSCTLSTLVPRPACIITRLPHTHNCENCPYGQRHTRTSSTTPALPSSLSAPQFPMPYEVIKPRPGPTSTGRPDARGIRTGRQRMIKLAIRFLWTHLLRD